jgi:hypothetical protein
MQAVGVVPIVCWCEETLPLMARKIICGVIFYENPCKADAVPARCR